MGWTSNPACPRSSLALTVDDTSPPGMKPVIRAGRCPTSDIADVRHRPPLDLPAPARRRCALTSVAATLAVVRFPLRTRTFAPLGSLACRAIGTKPRSCVAKGHRTSPADHTVFHRIRPITHFLSPYFFLSSWPALRPTARSCARASVGAREGELGDLMKRRWTRSATAILDFDPLCGSKIGFPHLADPGRKIRPTSRAPETLSWQGITHVPLSPPGGADDIFGAWTDRNVRLIRGLLIPASLLIACCQFRWVSPPIKSIVP